MKKNPIKIITFNENLIKFIQTERNQSISYQKTGPVTLLRCYQLSRGKLGRRDGTRPFFLLSVGYLKMRREIV
jgi:hypothetical protein